MLPVTVSLGVAERISTSDESPESLYERADARLYAAKAGGRNRHVLHQPGMEGTAKS